MYKALMNGPYGPCPAGLGPGPRCGAGPHRHRGSSVSWWLRRRKAPSAPWPMESAQGW